MLPSNHQDYVRVSTLLQIIFRKLAFRIFSCASIITQMLKNENAIENDYAERRTRPRNLIRNGRLAFPSLEATIIGKLHNPDWSFMDTVTMSE
jgi:hypothetical protein